MTHGGTRPGAGRKPGSPNHAPGVGRLPHSWRLKLGDTLILQQVDNQGSFGQLAAQIVGITRTQLTLHTEDCDYILVR